MASKDVVECPIIGGGEAAVGPPPTHNRTLNHQTQPVYDRSGFKAWESFLLSVLKFVDDNIIHEKLFMDGLVIDKNGETRTQATRSQNLLRQITRVAELLGMKVNSDKTMMLCISDSKPTRPRLTSRQVTGQ